MTDSRLDKSLELLEDRSDESVVGVNVLLRGYDLAGMVTRERYATLVVTELLREVRNMRERFERIHSGEYLPELEDVYLAALDLAVEINRLSEEKQ